MKLNRYRTITVKQLSLLWFVPKVTFYSTTATRKEALLGIVGTSSSNSFLACFSTEAGKTKIRKTGVYQAFLCVSKIRSFSLDTSSYKHRNKNSVNMIWHVDDLNKDNLFINEVYKLLDKGGGYVVLLKVRYNLSSFFMAGNQMGFTLSDDDSITDLLRDISERIMSSIDKYGIRSDDIIYIQISFRKVDKILYKDLALDRSIIKSLSLSSGVIKKASSSLGILSNVDVGIIGDPLSVVLDDKFKIINVNVKIKGVLCNFIDIIKGKNKLLTRNHEDAIEFNRSYNFHYIKSSIDYVLVVKRNNYNETLKLKYSLSGILHSKVRDIGNEEGNILLRIIGSEKYYFNNNILVRISSPIKLRSLHKTKIKYNSYVPNLNMGVIDIETYLDEDDNIQKISALGFKSRLAKEAIVFYIEKNDDSNSLVLKLINELLRPKYENIHFYCHNLGGYDVVYILKVLYLFNDSVENVNLRYEISHVLRDDTFIKLTIKRGKNKLVILDSYSILTASVDNLCKDYAPEKGKTHYPYKFAKKKNLNYVGVTPAIEYYNNISREEYDKIYSEVWCFKDVTIKYLINDLEVLFTVINRASEQLFQDYDINIMESATISGLAMKIYLNKYYDNNIPRINKASMYNDLSSAFYGGITEVYKPYGENLFYYDVNSLYPYAALNDMPGLYCNKLTYFEEDPNIIEDLFGFFYCKIEAPLDLYLGLLPKRIPFGIIFPLGSWEGWYFSEELKFAKSMGYTITVKRGYRFNRVKGVFSSYVEAIYDIKSNPSNNSQKAIAKSLLNNLIGRFGISLDKNKTEVMTYDEFDAICLIYKIVSYKEISADQILVTYVPKLDFDVIKSHGLDLFKVCKKYKDIETQSINNTSVVISAAVNAYARIHITKIKLDILSKKGQIYYSDTDSIVTNLELDKEKVDAKEIGKLKIEHLIKKGIFVTNKTYGFINNEGKFVNVAKGISKTSLNYLDYEKLLNEESVVGTKTSSKMDWQKGDVKITDNNKVKINYDSYTKRTKIYNIDGIWVDTKPIVLNSIVENSSVLPLIKKNKLSKEVGVTNGPLKSKTFKRSYLTKSLSALVFVRGRHDWSVDNSPTFNKVKQQMVRRAIGNFLKGVKQSRFVGIEFYDNTTLISFILDFDPTFKISRQSLTNLKQRNLAYKPLINTVEVQTFVKYIKLQYPDFKEDWLFKLPLKTNILLSKPTNIRSLAIIPYKNPNVSLIILNYDLVMNSLTVWSKTLVPKDNYRKTKLPTKSETKLDIYKAILGIISYFTGFLVTISIGIFIFICILISVLFKEDEGISDVMDTEINISEFIRVCYSPLSSPYFFSHEKSVMQEIEEETQSLLDTKSKSETKVSVTEETTPTSWVDSDDNQKIDAIIQEEKEWVKEVMRKRDVFDLLDIGDSIKRLFSENVDDDSNKNKIEDNSTNNVETIPGRVPITLTPLTPINELLDEIKNNNQKIDDIVNARDNRMLTLNEYQEYESLLINKLHLLQLQNANADSLAERLNKQTLEIDSLRATIADLKDREVKDSHNVDMIKEMDKIIQNTQVRLDKLLNDSEALKRRHIDEKLSGEVPQVVSKESDLDLESVEKKDIENNSKIAPETKA